MSKGKKSFGRSIVAAAAWVALGGVAYAQETIKVDEVAHELGAGGGG